MYEKEDPVHSIIDRQWEYKIIFLCYYQSHPESTEPYSRPRGIKRLTERLNGTGYFALAPENPYW